MALILRMKLLPWEKKVLGEPPSTGCFLQDNFNKIMNSESESEENARLKSSNHGKLPGGKRKKDDLEGEEAVDVTSYCKAESGGKVSRQ